MKRTKRFISILLCTLFVVSSLSTSVLAASNSEAIQLPVSELPSDAVLIDTTTINFIVDKNGNLINVYEGYLITPYSNTHEWSGQDYSASLYFYRSGSTYYVSLEAEADEDWWFTYHSLKIRPKNNSGWFTHSYSHETKPSTISDLMSFHYPDGAPSNVTVEVDGSFYLSSDNFLEKSFYWPSGITLDNPD